MVEEYAITVSTESGSQAYSALAWANFPAEAIRMCRALHEKERYEQHQDRHS